MILGKHFTLPKIQFISFPQKGYYQGYMAFRNVEEET